LFHPAVYYVFAGAFVCCLWLFDLLMAATVAGLFLFRFAVYLLFYLLFLLIPRGNPLSPATLIIYHNSATFSSTFYNFFYKKCIFSYKNAEKKDFSKNRRILLL
jgi:hypothetical protein